MTENNKTDSILLAIGKNGIGLAIFALVTAGVIGIVQLTTADKIKHNVAQAQAKALYEIIPKESVDNDLLADTFELTSDRARNLFNINLLGPIESDAKAYIAKQNGKVHAIIFPVVAPDGYTTKITMLVGVNLNGSLAGVRVVSHKETPGLGDKLEIKKSNWILDFKGKSLSNPKEELWKVKKDGGEFDQFTGATITPRAVVSAVKNTLTFFADHKIDIISLSQHPSSNQPEDKVAAP